MTIKEQIEQVTKELKIAREKNGPKIKKMQKKFDRIRKEEYIIEAHLKDAKYNIFKHMLGFKNVAQLKARIEDKVEVLSLHENHYTVYFDKPNEYDGMKVHVIFYQGLTFDVFERLLGLLYWIPQQNGSPTPCIQLNNGNPSYEFNVPTNIQCADHFSFPTKELYEKIITCLPRNIKEARNTFRIYKDIEQRHKNLEQVCDSIDAELRNLRYPIFMKEQELRELMEKKDISEPDKDILKDPTNLKIILDKQARIGDGFMLKGFDYKAGTAVFENYGDGKYGADLITKQRLLKRIGWALEPGSPIEIEGIKATGVYGGFDRLRFRVHLKKNKDE